MPQRSTRPELSCVNSNSFRAHPWRAGSHARDAKPRTQIQAQTLHQASELISQLNVDFTTEDRPHHFDVVGNAAARANYHAVVTFGQAQLIGEIRALHANLEVMTDLRHRTRIQG